MVNEKLIAFILKARQNKRTDDQISQQLLSVGWKQDAVSEAFAEIKSKNLAAQPQAPPPKQQKQPASPPWVKTNQPAAQPKPPPVQQPAAPEQPVSQTAVQPQPPAQPVPQAASQPQQPPITPPKQPAITPPPIQPPQQPSAPQQPIPPAKQIDLQQPQKKPFLSSIFGKKPPQPAPEAQQPTQKEQTAASPAQAPPQQPPTQPAPPVPQPQAPSILQPLPAQAQPIPPAAAQQSGQQQSPSQPPAQPAKPAAGIMKFLPAIAIVVLLAAVGAAYYFFVLAPASAIEQQAQQPPAVEQNATPANETQMAAGPLDCGTDLSCLAEASKECKPSKATTSMTEELMGVLVTSTSSLEIKGEEAGKCMLYVEAEDESVKLGDGLVVAALAKGTSMEEIRSQEAEATKQARLAVGLGGTCAFSTASLTSMLNRWKAGAYSPNDYENADCRGSLFEETSFSLSSTASLLVNKTSGSQATAKPNATQAPKANATNTTKANTTNATKTTGANMTTAPKSNATNASSIPKANASNAINATNATHFTYSRRFNSYFPEHLDWFCTDRDMEFYRMHWQEYFGGGCSVTKPKEGYVTYDEYVATNCTLLPCCINGPYNEYSRSYDYFECGYEEYVGNTGLEVKYTNRITLPSNSS